MDLLVSLFLLPLLGPVPAPNAAFDAWYRDDFIRVGIKKTVKVAELSAKGHSKELRKVIVGQQEVIEQVLMAIVCRGHALLVGVPGLAKTLLRTEWPWACHPGVSAGSTPRRRRSRRPDST